MSTSSEATASGRDQVPSDNPHLKTRICIFIVTRKDGTSLDVTSVSEEDIIEICMTLGHTHPLGVLWYSVMELVALFCTTEELQQASCSAIKAMELWDEPIAIQTVAPSEHHIRAYIAIVGGDPSKLWSPPSEGQGGSHSPTGNPHPGWGTLHHLQARAWWPQRPRAASTHGGSLPGDCTLKTACTPSNPQPTLWGEPSGSRNPNGDDQEVTFLRGGGWVPPRQPSPPPAPVQSDGGWVSQGPSPQPPRPAPAIKDVEHLISTWHWDYAWVPQE